MTNEELTRDVVGYEGIYTIDIFGNVIRVKDKKEVPQQKNKFGYMNVALYRDGKQKQHKVHRLIAQAFIPNPQNKKQVNHIDGDKTHNVVLTYPTQEEAELAFKHRGCGNDYRIVVLKTIEVKRIIERRRK